MSREKEIFFSKGNLISKALVSEMLRKQSGDGSDAEEGYYGYGMWIIDNPNGKDFAYIQGLDPGVSFLSEYNPNNGIISVLVSNYADNVWREMRKINDLAKCLFAASENFNDTMVQNRQFKV